MIEVELQSNFDYLFIREKNASYRHENPHYNYIEKIGDISFKVKRWKPFINKLF